MKTIKIPPSLFILSILLNYPLLAQKNLVPNPSFEEYQSCPTTYGKEKYLEAKFWTNYHYTPDYFHECAKSESVGVPNNFFGTQSPSEGKAYVGFTVYHSGAPNELIGMELLNPIQKGKKYKFSIKVSLAEKYSKYASDNIGILFTNSPEKAHNSGIYHFKSDKVIKDTHQWTTIEGVFFADDTYKHMLIGNFFDRTQTTIEQVSSSVSYEASYYFIDEVFVGELASDDELLVFDEKSNLTKGKTFLLKNIFFDFNQATLKAESFSELSRLITILKANPKLKIKITGHTDAIGKDADNQVLSEKRAKAVWDYLISKGIAKERLEYNGMGETEPIDTNNNEQGRANNRRVVFTIL